MDENRIDQLWEQITATADLEKTSSEKVDVDKLVQELEKTAAELDATPGQDKIAARLFGEPSKDYIASRDPLAFQRSMRKLKKQINPVNNFKTFVKNLKGQTKLASREDLIEVLSDELALKILGEKEVKP